MMLLSRRGASFEGRKELRGCCSWRRRYRRHSEMLGKKTFSQNDRWGGLAILMTFSDKEGRRRLDFLNEKRRRHREGVPLHLYLK